ncbi:MAG: helicase-related protein [Asticcacaulis sp.]|uniref:helicase-related protein n=1 Tax=Asticcacaulis sp. TaxID=1872648 RepID=UPI0039E518DF
MTVSSLDAYRALIASKRVEFQPTGLTRLPALNSRLKPHQEHSTVFALERGRAGLFLDTGLGKSFCALEYGRVVVEHTNRPVLMLAPLAVSSQHEREAEKFSIDAKAIRDPSEITTPRVYITNYERVHLFDLSIFGGVILDESSILKALTGKTSRSLIDSFKQTPFRLACTATPAPNDHVELGNHSEFLGALSATQMLTRFFLHDSADTGEWRMKGHAVKHFWEWVSSWSRCISKPSDVGFSDEGYILPDLLEHTHIVQIARDANGETDRDGQGFLFRMPDTSATSIHKEKRISLSDRVAKVSDIAGSKVTDPWVIWCDTDYEADELARALPDAVEVRGSMSPDEKEENLVAFSTGQARQIITKPGLAGFGLNWQHCNNMAFVGLSFSYENYYQAVRRCYRFGQTRPVNVHVVCADTEANIHSVVSRKAGDHDKMKTEMVSAMRRAMRIEHETQTYNPTKRASLPTWLSA